MQYFFSSNIEIFFCSIILYKNNQRENSIKGLYKKNRYSNEDSWLRVGIEVLNIIEMFSGIKIDYPDHWFHIAATGNSKCLPLEKGE